MRVAGLCQQLPSQVTDLLWGLDAPQCDDPTVALNLHKAGVYLCQLCPVRAQCLAWDLAGGVRPGLQGGLNVKVRRRLRKLAMGDGIRFARRPVKCVAADLIKWFAANPGAVDAAVQAESLDRKQRYQQTKAATAHRRNRTMHATAQTLF